MNDKINEIKADEFYSASAIVKNGWLWMKTVLTLTAFLRSDEGKRVLKPLILKRGAVTRYRIKGSEIIETMKLIDKGELKIQN